MTSVAAYAAARAVSSLERLLCLNLASTGATPSNVQRAICRLVDGAPLGPLASDENVIAAFGGEEAIASLPRTVSRLCLLAGVRCGKSLITGLAAIRATQVVDVSRLGPGEVPRVSVVSLTKDNATATFNHILGTIEAIPMVKALVVGEPTADSVFLRHPKGRKVEIVVAAGAKAAGSLVSRWFAGVIFDEAPRMDGAEDAVVNLDDQLRNLPMRMLPGAHVFMIGSPWAPFGPVYSLVEAHFGRPTPGMIVIRARASWMNPAHFTPEVIARLQSEDPDTYWTDELAQFTTPGEGLLALARLNPCIRGDDNWIPPQPRHQYAAAIDPATRSNGWSLVVGTFDGERWAVVGVQEWQGKHSEPLDPGTVLGEMATLLKPYGVDVVMTDQWSADAIASIARGVGLTLIEETLTAPVKLRLFLNVRTHVNEGRLSLPNHATLIKDLRMVQKKTTQTGAVIVTPLTPDGRHCDLASALALLLIHPLSPPIPEPERIEDDEAHRRQLMAEIAERARVRDRARFGR